MERAHVRPRFDQPSEHADILFERFFGQRLASRFLGLTIEVERCIHIPGFLGKEEIAVGAQRGDCERLLRQRDPLAPAPGLPRFVDYLLRPIEIRLGSGIAA